MSTAENTPIRPALVAAKLARIRNYEDERLLLEIAAEPRLVEAMWFLQFMSDPENNPGGLRKFATDLVAESRDLIGTSTMQKHTANELPDETLRTILEEIPDRLRWDICLDDGPVRADSFWEVEWDEAVRLAAEKNRKNEEARGRITRATFVKVAVETATAELPTYLRGLCEQFPYGFRRGRARVGGIHAEAGQAPWYFPRISEAILRFMDQRKAAVTAAIASTEVSREVFHWLHKARSTRSAVIIEGNSRFGKTEAVRAWVNMNPGLARYVKTPPSSAEGDLLRAIAVALGLDYGAKVLRGYQLRSEIEYVLKHSGLMLVFDEAQSLFPSTYGRNTAPARLNWVRCNVIDAGLPAAFVSTPQSYRNAERKFVKTTGFAIEQWSERILKTVHLPSEVGRDDLFAIARIHFPGLSDKYLEYVVERAAATERNYVSDVSKIARLAHSNAEDAGCSTPKFEHIISAINDVLPTAPAAPSSPAPRKSAARPVQAVFSAPENESSGRSMRPEDVPADRHFDRSLEASAEALLPG